MLFAACGGESSAPVLAEQDSVSAVPDTAGAERSTAPDTADVPADTSSVRKDVTEEPEPAPEPPDQSGEEWTAGIRERAGSGTGSALLHSVRAGRHDAFDRVVFEFDDALPGYHVEYVDRPVRACGSGQPVDVAGDGWLEVRFRPAHAHTDAGESTVPREVTAALPVVREVKSTCDFEGTVTWVIGVSSPNRYRLSELQDPPRLVVDVRH